MGDRAGLVIKDTGLRESFVLHTHDMGHELLKLAQLWLREERSPGEDCDTLAARFLMWLGRNCPDMEIDIREKGCYDDCEDHGVYCADMTDKVIILE